MKKALYFALLAFSGCAALQPLLGDPGGREALTASVEGAGAGISGILGVSPEIGATIGGWIASLLLGWLGTREGKKMPPQA